MLGINVCKNFSTFCKIDHYESFRETTIMERANDMGQYFSED